MKDLVDVLPAPSPTRMPGRPPKPDAKTPAQRAKAYRNRRKADGLKSVKCHLSPEIVAYLEALRVIHGITLGEAITMAVRAAFRGGSGPLRN